MRRIHLFCPAFMDTAGTVEFKEINFESVVSTLADPTNQIVWRNTWTGVREMLRRHGKLCLPDDDQRREIISAHRPMAVDEFGILFRTVEQMDLKSTSLRPIDFIFTSCYRLK